MVRRVCDQVSTGPSGVRDQSMPRMIAPISPPPARQAALPEVVPEETVGRPLLSLEDLGVDSTDSSSVARPMACGQRYVGEPPRPNRIRRESLYVTDAPVRTREGRLHRLGPALQRWDRAGGLASAEGTQPVYEWAQATGPPCDLQFGTRT